MNKDRKDLMMDPQLQSEENQTDRTLRPQSLKEYIGQEDTCKNLQVFLKAAKQRDEPLDHILLCGPPGLGKTTLANIMAHEMRVNIRITSGPALERAGDLAAILTNLDQHDVLFIDEIHRLNRTVEETLYPALEEFKIDVILGQGPSARSVRLDLPHFTLVGATTRSGLLSSPLRDRFGISLHLNFYSEEELQKIVKRAARVLKIEIDSDSANEIAKRSRGTPRISNRLLRRVRDFAQVNGNGKISLDGTRKALESLGVDPKGFDAMDRKILLTIIDLHSGGPVGLDTLAASIGEEKDTIEEVYEPFLLKEGYIHRTPKGRMATQHAFRHFDRKTKRVSQQELPIE